MVIGCNLVLLGLLNNMQYHTVYRGYTTNGSRHHVHGKVDVRQARELLGVDLNS